MDPDFLESLTIDQLLDALERKVESTFRNPFSYASDQTEWAEVNRYTKRGTRILARVKNRYNAFNPINRFAPEIFHHIFELVQWPRKRFKPVHVHPRYHCELKTHTQWLVVTQVCHYWRAISCSFPSLWCDILVDPASEDNRSMLSWFVERSAPMAFHVSQDRWLGFGTRAVGTSTAMNLSALSDLYHTLRPCSDRLESIFLQFNQGSQDVILKLLDLPLPSLLNLSLRYHPGSERITNLPRVLRRQISRVRWLYLDNLWCWPANMETFGNLIHLVLGTSTSMLEFVIMLKACPRLEVLHLRNMVLWEADVILPPHLSQLPGPNLKNLLLEISFPFRQLIQYLNLSPTISIYVRVIHGDWDAVSTLKELDAARGPNFEHQITTLEIRFGIEKSVCLHQKQLVLSVMSGLEYTLHPLSGRFPVLKEIQFSVANEGWPGRNNLKFKERAAASVYQRFLNGTPTLKTIYFKTPGFEDSNNIPLLNAISGSPTPIKELRVPHWVPGQVGCVEKVVERSPFPSYRLIREPCVPVVNVPLFVACLEFAEVIETNTSV